MSKFDIAVAEQKFWMKRLNEHLLRMSEPSGFTSSIRLNKYERQSFVWDISHEIVDELLKARDRKMDLSDIVVSDVFKATTNVVLVLGGMVLILLAIAL